MLEKPVGRETSMDVTSMVITAGGGLALFLFGMAIYLFIKSRGG